LKPDDPVALRDVVLERAVRGDGGEATDLRTVLALVKIKNKDYWSYEFAVEAIKRTTEWRRASPPAPQICRFDYSRDVTSGTFHFSLNQADGGGGNRTRVRRRFDRASTSLGCR
jgi:hypothetical protein